MAIHVGATFATWQDFKSALQDYSRETFTVWTIWSNRTVAAANKRLKQGPHYRDELVNAYAKLGCKHYGSSKTVSTGERSDQRLVIYHTLLFNIFFRYVFTNN